MLTSRGAPAPSLARRVAGLPAAAMRVAALGEALGRAIDSDAAAALDALVRSALAKEADALVAFGCLVDPQPVARLLGELRLRAIAEAAQASRLVAALYWLASSTPASPAVAAAAARVSTDIASLVHRDLRDVPLGRRRSLARQARGELLKKLVIDPDAIVVTNLLNNPAVTEAVVVAVCIHRPTVSAALEPVLASARWGTRYRVRHALARNPHLRLPLARNLLVCLDRVDIGAMATDGLTPPAVRAACRELLAV